MSTNVVKDGAAAAAAIVRANDLTNLGLVGNASNGAMKGNKDDVVAAVKSPATINAVAIPAPLFAEPDGTVSSINLSVDGRFEARISARDSF